jgi:AAA15 family ATPase/GTPase
MLVSFSVSNFRSFGEEQTLNMVASNKLADHPEHRVPIGSTGKYVLRAAVIYGANAAGKSNLVRAMRVAQQLILGNGDLPLGVEPFRFDRERLSQPSSFEFRFLLGERVFVYGFDVTSKQIVGEWLTFVSENGDELSIFERNEEGITRIEGKSKRLFPDDSTMFETLVPLAQFPVKNAQLFLNRIRGLPEASQGVTLGAVIRWLTHDLVILDAQHRVSDIVTRLQRDATFRSFSSRFMRSVGTGIRDLDVEESTQELGDRRGFVKPGTIVPGYMGSHSEFEIREDDPDHLITRRLLAEHDGKGERIPLSFSEESDGTQQLLHLMPVLSPGDENRVFVIDELDRSLHPLLCWEFIRFFSESLPKVRKQLIVTTHEAHLLNQELLRRDEYWFVEKDAAQQSRLVSLSDFNVRNDLQVEKGYLQGRFGAIPVIGSMAGLEKLLQSPGPEASDAP